MSFAQALFETSGVPQIWQSFSDDRNTLRYTFGDVVKLSQVVLRESRVEMVQDENGTLKKRRMAQLVIPRDETSGIGGVKDPQMKAVYEIEDELGTRSTWSAASVEGEAIVGQSATFTVINIMQTTGAARSHSGYRR